MEEGRRVSDELVIGKNEEEDDEAKEGRKGSNEQEIEMLWTGANG